MFITFLLILTSLLLNMNDNISLEGNWKFKSDPKKVGIKNKWYENKIFKSDWIDVKVPEFWENYPSLADYDGWGWFYKQFNINNEKQDLSIYIAGVDDDAEVWINGKYLCEHVGYNEAFASKLKYLKRGINTITVLVKDHGGGGGIYKPISIVQTKYLDQLLKSTLSDENAIQSPDWVKNSIIYSVYLRSFSKEGTFKALEERIPELKNLGVTVLWLLPIHPIGKIKRKGTLGSPYSVQDYYGINPEFGTLEDFKSLLNVVHKHEMKLIIDLVANHTSWDSKLINEHPEWFTKNSSGEIISPNDDWTDVADLDYSKPELRRYMIEMMKYWVGEIGIDGFRCDVSELVPLDFWEEAREELNQIKPVMMLSEGSLPEHHLKAFDITYSWNIYDALEPLLKGKRSVELIDQILSTESLKFPKGSLRMRFNTNHDKNAWDLPAVKKFGFKQLQLSAVLINTIPGIPMIYTGEEVANEKRLNLFEKVEVDWTRPKLMFELYQKLFSFRKQYKSLVEGEMKSLHTNNSSIYVFLRKHANDSLLVILNFSNKLQTLKVKSEALSLNKTIILKELFTGKEILLESHKTKHLEIKLKPLNYRIYELK